MAKNKEHLANIRFLIIEPQCRAEDEPLPRGLRDGSSSSAAFDIILQD